MPNKKIEGFSTPPPPMNLGVLGRFKKKMVSAQQNNNNLPSPLLF